MMRLHKIKTR